VVCNTKNSKAVTVYVNGSVYVCVAYQELSSNIFVFSYAVC
jgi:hypothetical protein